MVLTKYFLLMMQRKKWAYVENKKSFLNLENSLKQILYDSNLRKKTLECAMKKSKDFELQKIQKKFKDILGCACK